MSETISKATTETVIDVRNISVSLGRTHILEDTTLSIAPGEFVAVVGRSGCGKSTLLRAMGGLVPISAGSINISGQPVSKGYRELAYVFQSPRLAPWRDVLGNVLLGAELRASSPRRARDEHREEAESLIDLVGLSRVKHSRAGDLSGGEQQRVAIARALVVRPRALLMDEPFSALDIASKAQLRELLLKVWRETGVAVVFVTHDLREAVTLADRVVAVAGPPSKIVYESEIALARPRGSTADATRFVHELETAVGAPSEVLLQEGSQ